MDVNHGNGRAGDADGRALEFDLGMLEILAAIIHVVVDAEGARRRQRERGRGGGAVGGGGSGTCGCGCGRRQWANRRRYQRCVVICGRRYYRRGARRGGMRQEREHPHETECTRSRLRGDKKGRSDALGKSWYAFPYYDTVRYGEAENPGPGGTGNGSGAGPTYSTLGYRLPDGDGFKGARRVEEGQDGLRGFVEGAPDRELFALTVDTANSTGWAPLQRYLLKTDAHVVLGQEHHLRGEGVAAASQWSRKRGWKSLWVEAEPGDGGGTRGGVAIFARDHLGLARPPWGDEQVIPGRAAAAVLEAPGHRPLLIFSVYLRDGEGMSAANRAIMAAVGTCVQRMGHGSEDYESRASAMPFMIGADFNNTPEDVVATGFLEEVGAQIFAPPTRRGTCRTASSGRTIDFFVLDEGISRAVEQVTTVEDGTLATHVPVRLTFHQRVTCLKALGLRHPPALPTLRVHGPVLPPPCWRTVAGLCADAVTTVRNSGSEARAQRAIDEAYAAWAKTADRELQQITGKNFEGPSLRGEAPRLVWKSIVPERVTPREQGDAEPWRYADAAAREMMRTLEGCNGDGGDEEAAVWEEMLSCLETRIRGAGNGEGEWLPRSGPAGQHPPQPHPQQSRDPPWRELADLLVCVSQWASQRDGGGTQQCGGLRAEKKGELRDRLEALRERIREGRRVAEHADKVQAQERWRAWIAEGAEAGARNAHAAIRMPTQWCPTVAEESQHIYTSDPLKLLEAQRREYVEEWQAQDVPEARNGWRAMQPLPVMDAEHLRRTAAEVATRTTQTYDGFHPRHFSMLCAPALETLGVLFQAMEAASLWPSQVHLVTMPALPKPLGGFRLIGIFAAIYRIWSKARRPEAQEWEEAHDRPFFACGADRSAIDVVWRQAMRAEAAVASDLHAAAITSDLRKFYEAVDHELLVERAARHGFPLQIVKLAIAAYKGPRMIRLGAFIARELFASRGIIAGCSLATTFTRIYTISGYDIFVYRCPGVVLDNYIDDNVASTEGTEDEVAVRLANASKVLGEIVHNEFRCKFAPSKTRVVASSSRLGTRVRDAVRGNIGGQAVTAAANLGADCTAAKPRRVHGRKCQRVTRLREGLRRKNRVARVRSVLGDKTISVFATGTLAKMIYASEVHGLSEGELLAVRRAAAAAMRPRARGRSLNMMLALYRDPAWRAAVGPLLQYTRTVWRASRRGRFRAELSVTEIRQAWEAVDKANLLEQKGDRQKRMWSRVRGPLSATFLTLHRIGWRLDDPFTLTDDLGVTRRILDHSPALWADWAHAAVVRGLERAVASTWSRSQPEYADRRICLDHLRPKLDYRRKGGRRLQVDAMGVGIVRAAVCNAIWPNSRAHQVDSRVSPRCRLCGAPRDTIFHRLWHCPCTADERETIAGHQLIRRARAAGEGDRFYTTGVFPHPADVWPSAAREPDVKITRHDGGATEGRLLVQGNFYPDGSCTTHIVPELRRAGLAVSVRSESGTDIMTIDTPLWRELPQTPQAAEYAAYAVATQYLGGPSALYGDCENVVRDAAAGPATQLSARRRYAGIMRYTHSNPEQLRHWKSIHKVKAHLDIDTILDPELRGHALGNAAADAAAKSAVARHPAPAPAEVTILETFLTDAAKIVKLLAAALRKWPAETKRFAPRGGGQARAERPRRREAQHEWVRAENAWRCRTCLRCHLGAKLVGAVRFERCSGPRLELQRQRLADKGHSLCVAQGEGMPVKYCSRCGAWSTRRAFNLARECPRTPSAAGRQALIRIAKGRHPWLAAGRREEDRGFIRTTAADSCSAHRGADSQTGGRESGQGDEVWMELETAAEEEGEQRDHEADEAWMDVAEDGGGGAAGDGGERGGQHNDGGDSGDMTGFTGIDGEHRHVRREQGDRTVAGGECKRRRRDASESQGPPSDEQVHQRLLKAMAERTAEIAARRRAGNDVVEEKTSPAERIRAVRERCEARRAIREQGGHAQGLRAEVRGSRAHDHPRGPALPPQAGAQAVHALGQGARAGGDRHAARGAPGHLVQDGEHDDGGLPAASNKARGSGGSGLLSVHPEGASGEPAAGTAHESGTARAGPRRAICDGRDERRSRGGADPLGNNDVAGALLHGHDLRRDQGDRPGAHGGGAAAASREDRVFRRDRAEQPGTESLREAEGTPLAKRLRREVTQTRAQFLRSLVHVRGADDDRRGGGPGGAAQDPPVTNVQEGGFRIPEEASGGGGRGAEPHVTSRAQLIASLRNAGSGKARVSLESPRDARDAPGAAGAAAPRHAARPRYPSTDPRATRPG